MIDEDSVKVLLPKFQTNEQNIIREYCQHLFLSKFYRQEGAEKLLFKGGTALRLIWGSPRFSEDLDFSGAKVTSRQIDSFVEGAATPIEKMGIKTEILESKPTTGGHLATLSFSWLRFSTEVNLQISLRHGRSQRSSVSSIASDFIPEYTLVHLAEEDVVKEKIQALLSRAKPRDYYDLYFILRKRMAFEKIFVKDKTLKEKIRSRMKRETLDLRSELRNFLPTSHHQLLKTFKENLAREIERNLP